MVALLYAAYDTTSHGVSSSLYFLQKNLQSLNQLNNSLKASGIVDLDPKTGSDLKDLYENWDYLNNCIKESLRIDPPLAGSILYITKSEVEIWGIPLKKRTLINLHSTMIHHNSNIYPNPTEFIPERFDLESIHYFKNIDNGKDPRAYCPFSFGMRSWAGQSWTKLEMKVVLSRVLSKMRIEFNKETLKNNWLRFSIVSQAPLRAKFYSKF